MGRKFIITSIFLFLTAIIIIGYLTFGDFHFKNNDYEVSVDTKGNIKIVDSVGHEVVSAIQYLAEYGNIYNSLDGELKKGSQSIALKRRCESVCGSDKN
jgi:hypothetical protein